MRGRLRVGLAVTTFALSACRAGIGQTFEPGAEHVPGPANFLIRVEPPDAIGRVAFTEHGDKVVLFKASRGEERFLLGTDLPSTLRARVDGRECTGSIEMVSDIEYDGTLTINASDCELHLDLAHRAGAANHGLVDDGPIPS
jgi:hypothetical protein